MSILAQAATTLAADVRSLVDDLGRGFVSGGIAGAFYVVLSRSRSPETRKTVVVSACGLGGVGVVLVVLLAAEVM